MSTKNEIKRWTKAIKAREESLRKLRRQLDRKEITEEYFHGQLVIIRSQIEKLKEAV